MPHSITAAKITRIENLVRHVVKFYTPDFMIMDFGESLNIGLSLQVNQGDVSLVVRSDAA